ncbi:MAG: hypothetical protein LM580_10310, partial [Thermofilum sp.]|nr:hypothetical protein [Thermofilum sp.]
RTGSGVARVIDLVSALIGEIERAAKAAGINAQVSRQGNVVLVRISGAEVAKAIKDGIEPQYRQMVDVEAGDIVIKVRVV